VIASLANGVVAGAVAPLVMHSTRALALTSIGFMGIGLVAWFLVQHLWPQTGRALPADTSVAQTNV
jgi:DHA1 family bicyclomycin/chloramphenicol resistance-like MFS transporter